MASKKAIKITALLIAALCVLTAFGCRPKETASEECAYHCTLYIDCKTILENMDQLDEDKRELIPADGVILGEVTVGFNEGESVFDILSREMCARKIHMESSFTPVYDSAYIEGINNIYEFDCGPMSGWEYSVNGVFPNYGCSQYKPADGDVIRFLYTCDLGRDIGNEYKGG